METKKWNGAGFSLVELLIVIIISSVLFAAVGLIIVYANQVWMKSSSLSSMIDDARVAETTMMYQTRGAVILPSNFAKASLPVYLAGMPSGAFFYVHNPTFPGDTGVIAFNSFDHNQQKYKANRFIYNGSTIEYDWGYAEEWTFPPNPSYLAYPINVWMENSTILVNNATGMTAAIMLSGNVPFSGHAPAPLMSPTELKVQFTQSKQLIKGSSETVVSTTTLYLNIGEK